MTKSNMELAIKEILKWEGGYTNDPRDAGGATNWGITIADARKYWKKDATPADVKAMPQAVAVDIYRTKYWKTKFYDCDQLPSGVDLVVADAGVNSGPARADRWLKEAQSEKVEDTINKFCDLRLAFMKKAINTTTKEPLWPTYGKGWSRRVAGIRFKALQMATGSFKSEGAALATLAGSGASAGFLWPDYMPYIVAGTIITIIASLLLARWLKKGK
jgi:lysozyme family protein